MDSPGPAGRRRGLTILEGFHVENYRGLRDVSLGRTSQAPENPCLEPLTVLTGRTAAGRTAGKTSLLNAMELLAETVRRDAGSSFEELERDGYERVVNREFFPNQRPMVLKARIREDTASPPITYRLELEPDDLGKPRIGAEKLGLGKETLLDLRGGHGKFTRREGGEEPLHLARPEVTALGTVGTMGSSHQAIRETWKFLTGWKARRFVPDLVRVPRYNHPKPSLEPSGANLVNVLTRIRGRDTTGFHRLRNRLSALVSDMDPRSPVEPAPTVADEMVLAFSRRTGGTTYAVDESAGLLEWLHHLVTLHEPEPPALALVHDPGRNCAPEGLEAMARDLAEHARAHTIVAVSRRPEFASALEAGQRWKVEKDSLGEVHVRADGG